MTWRGVGARRRSIGSRDQGGDEWVQMHGPRELPFPGRGCAVLNRLASWRPEADWHAGGVGAERWVGSSLQYGWYGWVQLHHLPRELSREGRGCGDRKRPASYHQAEEWRMRARGGGVGSGRGKWGVRWRRRRKGEQDAPRGGGRGGSKLGSGGGVSLETKIVAKTKCSAVRQDEHGPDDVLDTARGGLKGCGAYRYGEAENPGPSAGAVTDEAAGGVGGLEGDEVGVVDAAWEAVRADPGWVPAWRTWSREVVTGSAGGRLCFALKPPQWEEEEGGEADGQVWEEEELEAFLQECEVEAGWRDSVDVNQGERLRREWREWEAAMVMAGIPCPRLEEGAAEGEVKEEGAEVFDSMRVPAAGGATAARKTEAEEGRRRKRRRWRPLRLTGEEGEPILEHEAAEMQAVAMGRLSQEQEAEVAAAPTAEAPRRSATVRPRGRRQRGSQPREFAVDVVTFNGSGAPQALGAMSVLSARRRSLGALLIQEHHGRGDTLADLQAGARARGMKLAPCEATIGKGGGVSAGVGVATPAHRGWGGIFTANWDLSPPGAPGRLAGAWLQVGPRGGMVALSIWCWPAEGMSQRNLQLVGKALEAVVASGCPWIIGGDLNATPAELVAAAGGLLSRAGAVVRAPTRPTCYPAVGRARTLDYFLVDARIAGAVSEAELVEEVIGSPHRAVKVSITGREIGGLVQVIRRPKMFPRQRPIGCPRMPLVPQGEGREEGAGGGEEDTLEEAWKKLAYCMEGELCRECDYVGPGGRLRGAGGRA